MGRAWFAAGIALAVVGTALTVVVLGRGGGLSVLHVVLTPVVGWSFGLAGLVACLRPRWRRVGALMVAVGLAWFVHLLDWTHVPALEAAAAPLRNAYAAVFAHLLLAFPTGRLGSKGTRALAAAGYLDAAGLHLVATTTGATIWYDVEAAAGVVLVAIVMAVLVRRTLKNSPRPATVVWCAALVACAALVGNLASAWLAPDLTLALWVVFSAAFAAVPFGFLASDQLDGLAARLGAAERRRIERNLHDGAQQRLVSVAFALGVAQSRLSGDPAAAGAALAEARTGLAAALDELRRLSQGIHPGVLVERGLHAGVAELAWASPVPVEVEWHAPGRLPEVVELAGYYVVAEALANVAKHARATAVRVRLAERRGRVRIEIMDDGVGGADIAGGSGLRGLAERVEAVGGFLTVLGGPAGGTTVRAELPCG